MAYVNVGPQSKRYAVAGRMAAMDSRCTIGQNVAGTAGALARALQPIGGVGQMASLPRSTHLKYPAFAAPVVLAGRHRGAADHR